MFACAALPELFAAFAAAAATLAAALARKEVLPDLAPDPPLPDAPPLPLLGMLDRERLVVVDDFFVGVLVVDAGVAWLELAGLSFEVEVDADPRGRRL